MSKNASILMLVGTLTLTGCAHQQFTCEEFCSKQAMVCGASGGKAEAASCRAPGGDQQFKQIVKARTAADAKDVTNKKADQDSFLTVFVGLLVFVGLGIITM